MHVVVVGCGRVGSELAGTLERLGHTVAIIDKKKDAFRRLPKGFGGYRIVGFGFDRDTLEEAGVHDAGAFAAVTSGDNSNIMAARVARETFEVDRVVARIYDPRRAVIYQRLGIPTVATVSWTTDQVMRRLLPGESPADWTDASGGVGLVERDLPAVVGGQEAERPHGAGDVRARRGRRGSAPRRSRAPTSWARTATSSTSWPTSARSASWSTRSRTVPTTDPGAATRGTRRGILDRSCSSPRTVAPGAPRCSPSWRRRPARAAVRARRRRRPLPRSPRASGSRPGS